ncbi:hypothetical protein RB2338 [Rhodopirellula baltica SH 1]|uniref:Uncharacterized protein n=1 Tax=Rhodopirellula baltica (strain DSM 10527 / NCIMB 13988 / SH1) TaxID=243090 RepID=Q7UW07_RHOBA|nr:hypothetical protein RB2338 [Rhodopirellula baltica SH 1]
MIAALTIGRIQSNGLDHAGCGNDSTSVILIPEKRTRASARRRVLNRDE